jgi:hypothetical protein
MNRIVRELLAVAKNVLAAIEVRDPQSAQSEVEKAIRQQEPIHFVYTTKEGAKSKREVMPVELISLRGRMAVKGYELKDPAKTVKMFYLDMMGEAAQTQQMTHDDAKAMYGQGKPITVDYPSKVFYREGFARVEMEWVEVPGMDFKFRRSSPVEPLYDWKMEPTHIMRYLSDGRSGKGRLHFSFIRKGDKAVLVQSSSNDVVVEHDFRIICGSDTAREYDVGEKGSAGKVRANFEASLKFLWDLVDRAERWQKEIRALVSEMQSDKELAGILISIISQGKRDFDEEARRYTGDWRWVTTEWESIKKAGLLRSAVPVSILKVLKGYPLRELEANLKTGKPFKVHFQHDRDYSHSNTGSGRSFGYELGVDADIEEKSWSNPSSSGEVTVIEKVDFNGRRFTLASHRIESYSLGT